MNLDEKDEKILKILEEKGRISYTELSEKIGISDVAAKKRVSKLSEAGIIDKFTIDVNYSKIGKPLRSYLFIKSSPETSNKIKEEFENDKRVLRINKTIGEYDLILEAVCKDLDELKRLSERDIGRLREVQEIRTTIITN